MTGSVKAIHSNSNTNTHATTTLKSDGVTTRLILTVTTFRQKEIKTDTPKKNETPKISRVHASGLLILLHWCAHLALSIRPCRRNSLARLFSDVCATEIRENRRRISFHLHQRCRCIINFCLTGVQ